MHQLFSPILVLRSVVYLLPSLTHLMNLERPQHLYEHLIAGLTGLEPAILGLTNLRCIPLKLQTNFEDCGNFEIPTRCLTNNRSASELTIHAKVCLSVSTTEPRTTQVGLEPTFSFFVDPVGIEPTPLVLQTSVRTSYTKGTILTTA